MSRNIQSVRGMNDILPGESELWELFEDTVRSWLKSYGYKPIRLPVVEPTPLFKRAIGEVTDIVEKEMYSFTDSLNGELLTLRPEGTAGCVRAVIQHKLAAQHPQRLYYMGQMFRHERPQKGRYRQFNQVGVEAFGFDGPDIDAELILMGAILAVKPLSAVKIMLPMVTDVAEIAATRVVLDRLTKEMGITERVELGVMIETPSAAILADQLAQEADFFSVGTNDLTQYALCMDRTNPALAARVDGLHPAVLRLLAQAAHGAARNGKWLGVCGAMASDPIAVPLLIGLGVTELSVSPAVIPEIKAVVRRVSLAECRSVAQAALHLTLADAIRASVKAAWPWLEVSRG